MNLQRQRQTVKNLAEGDQFKEVYVVRSCDLKSARNGSNFLTFEFGDATGGIRGILWDAQPEWVSRHPVGSFARVSGVVESYQGRTQVKVRGIEPVEPSTVCPGDFLVTTPYDLDELRARLFSRLDELRHPFLRQFVEALRADETLMRKFAAVPAAMNRHHAYLGGLLEHVVSMLDLADKVAAHYPFLRRDLLYLGVLLHDLMKTDELTWGITTDYSTQGRLVGHIAMGAALVDRVCAGIEGFPEALKWELQHLILAHHGSHEFGSPVLPATLEALALHYIDDLDGKLWQFRKVLEEVDGQGWSGWNKAFGRSLYRGGDAMASAPASPESPASEVPSPVRSAKSGKRGGAEASDPDRSPRESPAALFDAE